VTDVVIAGGSVAGSALAILLGRAGVGVEIYEQHSFPRDKACAEGLMPAGAAVLDRMGLTARVGGARFQGIRYRGHGRCVHARFPAADGIPGLGLAQRRLHLDATLFAAARATPGVTAHDGVRVEGPLLEGGRIKGVKVGGQTRRAALVVAADGPRSGLRRRVDLDGDPVGTPRLGVRIHYRLAPGRAAGDEVQIFLGQDHEIYVTPLPDGEISVAALACRDHAGRPAGAFFQRAIACHRPLLELLEGAQPRSDLGGRTPLHLRARHTVLPGLLLLGDAALALDPITGAGMAQALQSAELLARSLVRLVGGRREFNPSDDVLTEFDRRRRALYREPAVFTGLLLQLVRRPRLARATMALLDRSPPLFTHLCGMAAGTRPLLPL
jgi:2-polyprenyl-6-methoxyphenol hydroxylase-like FAD-dependent oxidoreductase